MWDVCSHDCGGGERRAHRDVTQPPLHGGAECPPLEQHTPCAEQPCPLDCVVSAWEPWGLCSKICGEGATQTRFRTIVSSAQYGGVSCPAIYDSQECMLQSCPIHCGVTGWESWSSCDKTCGGGVSTRKRYVHTPAAFNGTPCPALLDTQICNMAHCPQDCVVSGWSSNGMCSQSCGGGSSIRSRSVIQPTAIFAARVERWVNN